MLQQTLGFLLPPLNICRFDSVSSRHKLYDNWKLLWARKEKCLVSGPAEIIFPPSSSTFFYLQIRPLSIINRLSHLFILDFDHPPLFLFANLTTLPRTRNSFLICPGLISLICLSIWPNMSDSMGSDYHKQFFLISGKNPKQRNFRFY